MLVTTTDVATDAPQHPTPGASWPFALVGATTTSFADSLTELVGTLIPDYARMDDDEAFVARCAYAAAAATVQQQVLLARSGVDVADVDESVLQVLLTPREVPVTVGSWAGPVPLVLVRTDYAPFSATPEPTGQVWFIDPSGERELLTTLSQLGIVSLLTGAR
ncbi:hypothetical protein [Isoptericola croceus]|uniref:hypothetical protein n=1 Tax=Isoptericola croceus TaxID=3031406 RepID=UPI0023F80FBE|nr:hypothetical protein [Isoptericola croceus]